MIFSIRSRVSLLSGWAMSLNVPSLRRFAGMATNSPVLPLITLRSRTTKHASNVMVTYAFRRSSFTGKTRTSVISMEDPSRMTPRPMIGRYLPASLPVKPPQPSAARLDAHISSQRSVNQKAGRVSLEQVGAAVPQRGQVAPDLREPRGIDPAEGESLARCACVRDDLAPRIDDHGVPV